MKAKFVMVNLPVSFLQEENKFIAYTPALDLSTCGDTFEKAKKRFEEILQIFIDEAYKMGTLEEVLQDCGWRKARFPRRWIPPITVGQPEHTIEIPIKG
jgi:predicted RNase H-like HicB family nuclease